MIKILLEHVFKLFSLIKNVTEIRILTLNFITIKFKSIQYCLYDYRVRDQERETKRDFL